MTIMMGTTTPKRKNHSVRRDSQQQHQKLLRHYEADSLSCSSSSESGGASSPSSSNLPLHVQQQPPSCAVNRITSTAPTDGYSSPSQSSSTQHDNSSAETPTRIQGSREEYTLERRPGTPTPTTTIGRARSPRTKHLSRPTRRRGHRSTSSLTQLYHHGKLSEIHRGMIRANNKNHIGSNKTGNGMRRSGSNADCSIVSLESNSEHSRLSRYSGVSKNSGTSLSRRGSSSANLHGSHHPLYGGGTHSHSLFGVMGGSTYSKTDELAFSLSSAAFSGQVLENGDSYDYYEKHHHPSHHCHHHNYDSPTAAGATTSYTIPSSPNASSLPPLPSLRMIASELTLIGSLYCRHAFFWMRKPCRKLRHRFLNSALMLMFVSFALILWLSYDFYTDAVDMCTPPSSSHPDFSAFLSSMEANPSYSSPRTMDRNLTVDNNVYSSSHENNTNHASENANDPPRPLVEYYVHGRGIGHYARSVAIVEQLNRAGVDVRMFLTRASMWRAMHEDARIMIEPNDGADEFQLQPADGSQIHPAIQRGKTTAIAISSLTPDLGFFGSLSHTLERVSGDCEVSKSSGRYPQLIVTDGDFPGMLRAEFGGIPSVGIAHGQLFSIANKPQWVQESSLLNHAWNKQGRLNTVSSWFTEWQIATHFCFLESRSHSGTVARAPLRPEVLMMAEARKWARRGKLWPVSAASVGWGNRSRPANMQRLPQAERIRKLLLPIMNAPLKQLIPDTNRTLSIPKHRKLIICYFRDHNGEHVVKALLDAGFDVLLFETHYTKEMADNPNRYGLKWIARNDARSQERSKYINGGKLRGKRQQRRLSELVSTTNAEVPYDHNNTAPDIKVPNSVSHKNGPKLIRVMDRSLFVPLMHIADGVASSAGSQLMSECIYSNMPLLALYKEDDSEQRLNVELSHHVEAPCHRPLVFGTSFERINIALQANVTSVLSSPSSSSGDSILRSFQNFLKEVKSSSVSETYYRNADLLLRGEAKSRFRESEGLSAEDNDAFHRILKEDDPFLGLPDAAAIILEIMKQVVGPKEKP